MFRFTCLILVFHLVFGDPHFQFYTDHKDGPCPKPTVDVENLEKSFATGDWYAVSANIEKAANKRQCFKVIAEEKNGAIYAKRHFRDIATMANVEMDSKYVHVPGEPGRAVGYNLKDDGEYHSTGFTYSLVKAHEDTILVYSCKEKDDKHIDFYRVFSKTLPVPEESKAAMKEAYEATGDDRTIYFFKHDNC